MVFGRRKAASSTILETKASRFYWRSTGYKGKDHHPENVQVHLSNKSRKNMTRWERMWMNRRSAIEPVISHLKHDHNMIRNFLKGREGDRINALFAAAGCNFSKLLVI
ncbi:transposase DDE domain protein [Leptospira sp. Fiocruz LV3954]|nr:transposase DDE domain protein [Leptospira sp. Fiocruz LV3954]